MAVLGYRTFSLSPPATKMTVIYSVSQPSRRPLIAAHKPSKLTSRKNHLRPKILKTLTKTFAPITTTSFPEEPPTNPPIPTVSPETPADHLEAEAAGEVCGDKSHVSEHSGIVANISAKDVVKYGAYLALVFVLQTVFAVWVFGSSNSSSSSESDLNAEDRKKENAVLNGDARVVSGKFSSKLTNVVYLDESDVEKRIEEIRLMARQARCSEKRQKGDLEGSEIDDGDAVPERRVVIEKEIGSRLDKLQNKLDSARKASGLSKNVALGGVSNTERGASSLIFKKKLKFRNPSEEKGKQSHRPKGFQNLEDRGMPKSKSSSKVDRSGKDGRLGLSAAKSQNKVNQEELAGSKIMREGDVAIGEAQKMQNNLNNEWKGESKSFSQEETKIGDVRGKSGIVQKVSQETDYIEGVSLKASRDSSSQSSQSSSIGKPEITNGFSDQAVRSVNIPLKHKEMKAMPTSKRAKDRQSDQSKEFWWLNLPCVFAILMRRGNDLGETAGFFTLKIDSEDGSDTSSYTVTFEDRVDANNFCFLLESFFEELGDFGADIVPLLRKELEVVVKEQTMNLIVVRQGQLRLYAGQPFSDVELALKSLVEHNLTSDR